ncbi:sulfur carrier protein ThiS adenylyltransferase ThiF [Serpentinicella sp. ANB-PHB4]|uniref:sulfur carrier protein ThiS adenylyltransferase ThiF n=1 Tax=Serpentinicella sp. ANB-PHB4 TaxID=3074076 RepID=UPI002861D23A|nr:sulfur carrier protein ThiS adenylyltransferase ThiF [Serpentinicella sp. ANB-PHB4]MDR5658722.1 sulfur carrier protein ThiS adenylyltransferase ThiF [Serpentinicella sp. ANB-PHB4]
MRIKINEREIAVSNNLTVFELKNKVKKEADIVIYNGFIIKEDQSIKEGDCVSFIKRGEMPSEEDMEALLVSRHTPGVHQKIKNATVGIAGLGGLGSNIAISLARIGIGKLLLVDFDVVEPSNLNRQQYLIKHIGMYKTDALKALIHEINPFVEVETKNLFLETSNIKPTFENVDVVVEAFDNPNCKADLVTTTLTQLKGKPVVAASGLAGYASSNQIETKKVKENFYLVGDDVSEAKPGSGLMAPRVGVAANHQANMVLRILLDEKEI